ncbi:MAG TPA: hypothetical protein VIV11_33265, partial [Kofleriaceae bacterium]
DPVILNWRGPDAPPSGWVPGFGRADTIVAVPLSPTQLLLGIAGEPSARQKELPSIVAATYNTQVALNATRWIYFQGASFVSLGDNTPTDDPSRLRLATSA